MSRNSFSGSVVWNSVNANSVNGERKKVLQGDCIFGRLEGRDGVVGILVAGQELPVEGGHFEFVVICCRTFWRKLPRESNGVRFIVVDFVIDVGDVAAFDRGKNCEKYSEAKNIFGILHGNVFAPILL